MPKKTKAIKKTDIDAKKPWLKKVGITILEEPSIEPSKTFLIVCEGQTEELYFKSFPSNSITVKCLSLGCSNFQLVNCTIDLKNGEDFDEVWVVFDMDFTPDKGPKQKAAYDNSIRKALDHDIKVAYSNDCFELWFYLHYYFTDQQNLRYFYYKELSKIWDTNYEKEGKTRAFAKNIFSLLRKDDNASAEKAVVRAESLYERQKDLPFHQQNPISTVFQLFKSLSKSL
ncbi:MAG: RloB family protein [Bacteroidota bacterium]